MRTRAADASGKIGGPRVVDAVLVLVKDDNQDIRRAAIEILNQTKDERAVAQLLEATRDKDWWVSERAVDALGGDRHHQGGAAFHRDARTPVEPKSLPTVVRAIAKIGDAKSIEHLLPLLQRPENEIKIEAIAALAKLADERRADTIRLRLQTMPGAADGTINQSRSPARMQELDNRFSTLQIAANQRAEKMQEPAKTLLIDNQEISNVVGFKEARGETRTPRYRHPQDPATSSRVATNTSRRSARARSARYC